MRLSILIPAVYERGLGPLYANLAEQAAEFPAVEILTLFDNRRRSTGLKRQALLDLAKGEYITCLDDDDNVASDYIVTVLEALREQTPDVLSFNSEATLDNGNPFIVRTGLDLPNEQCRQVDGRWVDITRKPWHWCVWSAVHAKQATFPDGYIDDDWFWLRQLMWRVKKEHHIDRTLHYYRYDSHKSLAGQGKPTT